MSRIRDIANILSASTDMATDAEVAASYASKTNPTFTAIGGDEGGQINLAAAATNTTLSGPISVDIYQNKIRFFENGGSSRGSYINLANQANGAGSEIITGLAQSGNTGKSLVTNGTTAVWQENQYAGKNLCINGGMDVWQRGTSFASSNSTYVFTADRWEIVRHGYLLGMTVTRQTAGLDGFRYCARIQRDSGNTSTNNLQFQTSFETSEVLPFINKTMTISFYARKSSTASANSLNAQIIAGTGTDQAMKNYTGGTVAFQQTFTLTDSWQRFSFSGSVASPYTEFGIWFGYTPSGTAGAADYIELTGVQIEQGSTYTTFSRTGGNYATELDLCRRYYFEGYISVISGGTNGIHGFLFMNPMRTTPSVTFEYDSTNNRVYRMDNAARYDLVSPTIIATPNALTTMYAFTPAGWAGSAGIGFNAYWRFNAEL